MRISSALTATLETIFESEFGDFVTSHLKEQKDLATLNAEEFVYEDLNWRTPFCEFFQNKAPSLYTSYEELNDKGEAKVQFCLDAWLLKKIQQQQALMTSAVSASATSIQASGLANETLYHNILFLMSILEEQLKSKADLKDANGYHWGYTAEDDAACDRAKQLKILFTDVPMSVKRASAAATVLGHIFSNVYKNENDVIEISAMNGTQQLCLAARFKRNNQYTEMDTKERPAPAKFIDLERAKNNLQEFLRMGFSGWQPKADKTGWIERAMADEQCNGHYFHLSSFLDVVKEAMTDRDENFEIPMQRTRGERRTLVIAEEALQKIKKEFFGDHDPIFVLQSTVTVTQPQVLRAQ